MFKRTLMAVALLGCVTMAPQVNATSLAFEFGSGAAGFSVEATPRDDAPRARSGGMGWRRGDGERSSAADQDIIGALQRQGFRDVRNLQRRGAIYQAQALDSSGLPVGLVLSARNGAILNVYRVR